MRFYAYMTGERLTAESVEHGDAAEHGWVDTGWGMSDLFPSRNDVKPVSVYDTADADDLELYPSVKAWREATVAEWLGGAEDNGDGTVYGTDEVVHDYTTGDTFRYALHFSTVVTPDWSARRPVEADVDSDGCFYRAGGYSVTFVNGQEVARKL